MDSTIVHYSWKHCYTSSYYFYVSVTFFDDIF